MFFSAASFFQRATSPLTRSAKACGVLGAGSQASVASRALTSGCSSAWLMTLFMRATTAAGVPAGASTPNQASVSKPGSASARAGTSGRLWWRLAVVTASASTRPALICADHGGRLPIITCDSPLITAATAGAAPL